MLKEGSRAAQVVKLSEQFERLIVLVLLVSLMVVVLLGTIGLIWMIAATLYEKLAVTGFVDSNFTMPLLHEVFTGFLMILIGLELMKTIVMYLDDHVVHVEVVLSVALIAIARHVIDLDLKNAPPLNLIGTGAIIFALAIGYYYFSRTTIQVTTPLMPTTKE